MAKFSDVVRALAGKVHEPATSVTLAGRYAREGGHITQGARGVNAPNATSSDASNLLIAWCASPTIQSAAETIEKYRALRQSRLDWPSEGTPVGPAQRGKTRVKYQNISVPPLDFLSTADNAGAALDGLIEAARSGALRDYISPNHGVDRAILIEFDRPRPAVTITVTGGPRYGDKQTIIRARYEPPLSDLDKYAHVDITTTTRAHHHTLLQLGEVLK